MVEYKRLGDYIEPIDERNSKLEIKLSQGINNNKYFQEPKQVAQNSTADKIVRTGYFAYNRATTRNGEKISIAYREGPDCTVSSAYQVFRIKDEELLNPKYLMMYFNRSEFDRYARYKSHGSAHEFFDYEDMSEVYLPVPSIEQQRKYVDVYLALQNNLAAYQSKVEELKLVCDGYIEDLRRNIGCEKIGKYIRPVDERNSDLKVKLAQGITIDKEFANPKQVAEAEGSAKIVRRNQFAYNRATTRNGEKISIAYRTGEDCVVSSAYQVFEISAKDAFVPEYLMMWFKRAEFDRYARYMSKGSAHEFFEYEDMEEVRIPIPSTDIQKSIASIYKVLNFRK